MRVLILVAGALALAACSNNDNHDNTTNVDENLTAENIVSNDVTAIDAVTGDDANMAADVNYTDLGTNETSALNDESPAKASTPHHSAPKPTPVKPPANNTAATSNAQ
jgi:hypothetical protein